MWRWDRSSESAAQSTVCRLLRPFVRAKRRKTGSRVSASNSLAHPGLWIGTLKTMGMGKSNALRCSPQDKAFPKWIVRVKVEFVPACDGRRAADFRNDCLVWSKPDHLNCLHRHHAADNALNRNFLAEF